MTPDHDLKRRLLNTLLTRQVPGLPAIQIDVRHGTVTVRGSLPSAQARRICLECARHVAGVMELKEELPRYQLFHLGRDPGEQTDVLAENPEVAQRLQRQLAQILASGRSRQP